MYHALYRKYRPLDFDSVVGQNSIITTLKNSIINKTFTHAYMFFGPRGTGKTTVSKIFARSINCLDSTDGISCGKCKNCLVSYDKECVDIIEIDAASNNGVDEIRELKNKISLVPSELKYKVYIIDEVHMLSIGAFNALLKTLEEPPDHVVFILATTDPQKVPETIISRCQCFSFKRISNEMIVKRLKFVCEKEKIEIDDEVLNEIAISSDGGLRDALGVLDKLVSYSKNKIDINLFAELNYMITKVEIEKFCNFILDYDIYNVLKKIEEYDNNGKNLIQIINQVMYYLRNIVVDYYISNKKINYSIDIIENLIFLLNEKMFDIKRSENIKIFLEILLLKFINENTNINIISKDKQIKPMNNKDADNSTNNIENSDSKVETNNEESLMKKEEVILKDLKFESKADISESKILNINEIIDARVNNTLTLADKKLLKLELDKFELLKDYTFDQEIGYIICTLLDGKVRAVSPDNLIISYDYDSIVKQNLNLINKIEDVYNKITNSNKRFAIISDERWNLERDKYIQSVKKNIQYEIMKEPEEVLEENKTDGIINSNAIELFGDIVEID